MCKVYEPAVINQPHSHLPINHTAAVRMCGGLEVVLTYLHALAIATGGVSSLSTPMPFITGASAFHIKKGHSKKGFCDYTTRSYQTYLVLVLVLV